MIGLIGVVLVIVVVVFFIVRRQRGQGAIADRAWRYDSRPTLAQVQMLGNPPFDVGMTRAIADAIIGQTSNGFPFQSFVYMYTGGGGTFTDRVAMVNLPKPLPELYVHSRSIRRPRRTTVRLPEVTVDPSFARLFAVRAADPDYADVVLNPAVREQIRSWAATRPVDLSIDHQSLVALGAPKDQEKLTEFVGRLSAVATAMNPPGLQPHAIAPKDSGQEFYDQDWVQAGIDNGLIPHFNGIWPFGIGSGHRTSQVVRGSTRQMPMVSFIYHWRTTHTETSNNGKKSATTGATDNHEQPVIALTMPVEMPTLIIGTEGLVDSDNDIDVESEAFNDVFHVSCSSRAFAHNVLQPTMLQFLLAARPDSFLFHRNMLIIYPRIHDTEVILKSTDFLASFLRRIPSSVWKDLGTDPPPIDTPQKAPELDTP